MEFIHVGLNHFIGLGSVLFGLGLYGIITRKNPVTWLIGLQLILSACNIIMVSFSRFENIGVEGQILPVFIIIIGGLQILVFAAIIKEYSGNSITSETDNSD